MQSIVSPSINLDAGRIRQFHEEGYFILERAIPEAHLALARTICDEAVAEREATMRAEGKVINGIDHLGKLYFVGNQYLARPRIGEFIFSELMAAICSATLGDTSYLFLDQFVVKSGERGRRFSWHQDSGYIGHPHRPYLTCWCALDDVNQANGTIHILPHSRSGVRTNGVYRHERDEETNDMVGYRGDDPGIPVEVPAGSIAVFSSTTLHCSGFNGTAKPRRAYIVQYSAEPITSADGSKLWQQAEPFVSQGARVRQR